MGIAAESARCAAIEDLFGPDHAWVSPWVATLPAHYFNQMVRLVGEWEPATYRLDTAHGLYHCQAQAFIRLSQAHDHFVPWLSEAVSLDGARVLEIGCGTGSSTAALLIAGANVLGLELDASAMSVALERCKLLGIDRMPRFQAIAPNWLETDANFDWTALARDYAPTVVVCYALLEHLSIQERFVLLRNAMRALPLGGHLVIFETPNRLMTVDWHTTKMLFSEILPDELALRYLALSPRKEVKPETAHNLYRWGRGVSFHEFQLAIGLENFAVVLDGYDGRVRNWPNRTIVKDYEEALQRILAEHSIPKGFARPSLDLVMRKTAEPVGLDTLGV